MISNDFTAAMEKVDVATTQIGSRATALGAAVDGVSVRFDALKASIGTNMTAEEVATVKAVIDADTTKLDAVAAALDAVAAAANAIGVTPTDPVPVPVPELPVI